MTQEFTHIEVPALCVVVAASFVVGADDDVPTLGKADVPAHAPWRVANTNREINYFIGLTCFGC